MKTRLLLVDTHPVVYRNYFAKSMKDLKTSTGIHSGAFYGSLKTLLTLKNRFPNAYMLCAFDGGSSGRHEIYPEYKPMSERAEVVQDAIEDIKSFCLCVGIPILYKVGIEADDLISISAHMWLSRAPAYHSMIVSSDMDFFQLVSRRITMFDDRAKKFYGPDEVLLKTNVRPQHFLNYKALKGDTADHIPGIPGFGVVKSAKAAPQGILAAPEGYRKDFMRNQVLMKLPKDFREMGRCLDDNQQRIYRRDIHNIFQNWDDDVRPLRIALAQQLLKKYGIKSLKVEDFL